MTIPAHDVLNDDDQELRDAITRVTRQIADECSGACCDLAPSLERCVRDTVRARWEASRIKTYVPLLALNDVRPCIQTAACPPPGDRAWV